MMLVKTLQTVRESMTRISSAHRDLHSSVSKVGKAVDRNFVGDFDSTSREEVFAGADSQRRLNEGILQHLYRHGQLEIGDVLAEEAGLQELKLSKEPFQELNGILEALKGRNLVPGNWKRRWTAVLLCNLDNLVLSALEWAARNRNELNLRGTSVITQGSGRTTMSLKSSLEMKLHKLQFIELLRQGNRVEAIRQV
jgi:E3 ubiquitin-protein transferase RMND5